MPTVMLPVPSRLVDVALYDAIPYDGGNITIIVIFKMVGDILLKADMLISDITISRVTHRTTIKLSLHGQEAGWADISWHASGWKL